MAYRLNLKTSNSACECYKKINETTKDTIEWHFIKGRVNFKGSRRPKPLAIFANETEGTSHKVIHPFA